MNKKIKAHNNLISCKGRNLKGVIVAPPDKSISHRSLLFASLSIGTSSINNLLNSDDVFRMVKVLKNLGVKIKENKEGVWFVSGVGLNGYDDPKSDLDCGNSGTLARILLGALSGSNISVAIKGDKSLNKRPMDRVIIPLKNMGINFSNSTNLPLTINGQNEITPIKYEIPVSSAQVKTAVLLAGLNARGTTQIIEPQTSRNHTENLLKFFGADISYKDSPIGKNKVSIKGGKILRAQEVDIPGDISSAAFAIVAASIIPNSNIKIKNVGVNYYRIGILTALKKMGVNLKLINKRINEYDEPVSDIEVNYSKLKPINLKASYSAIMIDEYPILAVAAAATNGRSRFCGLSELRYKESNRFNAIIDGLNLCGISVKNEGDDILIEGNRNNIEGGIKIDCDYDHRVAMSFLVLGAISKKPIEVVGCDSIITSYPNFCDHMNSLGLKIKSKFSK